MIGNFKLYSAYYDLLYKDKDYRSEAAYVNAHLKQLLPGVRNILELGSGTGNHAKFLSLLGYHITGIDGSMEMIKLSENKAIINFQPLLADITDFDANQQFDAAIALFHSICYLTENSQLLACFKRVSVHLKAGGVFAFDFWYAPAVLHHLPISRNKFEQDEVLEISRKGETTMFVNRNVAEVNYEVAIKDKHTGHYKTFSEKHPMRYLSIPEIAILASHTGFEMVKFEEFLTGEEPSLETRNVFVVFRKLASEV